MSLSCILASKNIYDLTKGYISCMSIVKMHKSSKFSLSLFNFYQVMDFFCSYNVQFSSSYSLKMMYGHCGQRAG